MINDRLVSLRQNISWAARRCGAARGTPNLMSTLGLGVVLTLAGCDSGLFKSQAPPPVVEKSASKAADDYIIGSGDQLSIFVYRNPDLSEGGVAVRPDGGSRRR